MVGIGTARLGYDQAGIAQTVPTGRGGPSSRRLLAQRCVLRTTEGLLRPCVGDVCYESVRNTAVAPSAGPASISAFDNKEHIMEVLRDIPFSLDIDSLMTQSLAAAESDDAWELRHLVDLATKRGRPKAAYAEVFVEGRDSDRVRLGDIWFTSRALSRHLESVERVFAFVATCGRELDDVFSGRDDMMQAFRWDLIKTALLHAAEAHVHAYLHRTYALAKTATMRPGSADQAVWPIEQQQQLFALIGDVTGGIGVTLTPSSLMIPDKSTSGVLFPTERDFRSCELCHREKCPSRRAAFNEQLWTDMHDS